REGDVRLSVESFDIVAVVVIRVASRADTGLTSAIVDQLQAAGIGCIATRNSQSFGVRHRGPETIAKARNQSARDSEAAGYPDRSRSRAYARMCDRGWKSRCDSDRTTGEALAGKVGTDFRARAQAHCGRRALGHERQCPLELGKRT